MKRAQFTHKYPHKTNYDVEVPEIDAFISDIEAVCRKHNMSISHEDGHGAFEIEVFSEANIAWLSYAHDARGVS